MKVDRRQVVAFRMAAQGLHRTATAPADLAVTALGVQDTPAGTARLALAARTTAEPADDRLAMVWSLRGAPHLHRRADLATVAAAIWPLDDADARARIDNPRVREGAKLGRAAFTAAATAMHEVVTGPMAKGEVSGAVTARIPESLSYWCEPCGSRHVSGALFQQVGVASGTQLVAAARTTTLAPIDDWPGPPQAAAGTADLVRTYLRLLGPATDTEVAGFLGCSRAALREVWPADLVAVDVDGKAARLPEDAVSALRDAPPPPDLVLLPAGDPYLQARDRTLLVPDPDVHAAVWKPLGNPGVVVAAGEVVATWRAKLAGKRTLEVTVTPIRRLPAAARTLLDAEVARLAAVRGAPAVRLVLAG